MIREYLFSEEYGRNIIWIMLSGFFLRIGAKENIFGQIIMPKDHYLFNLDNKIINNDYLNYKNLHYFLLDGATEYLSDLRLKNLKGKENLNLYYVGKLNSFWKNIKNTTPLFSENLDELNDIIPKIKKTYPIFFKKYLLKKIFTTLVNLKNLKLCYKHIFSKTLYVYYGYIRPTDQHLKIYQNHLKLEYDQYKIFFDKCNNYYDLKEKINNFCILKEKILTEIKEKDYPYFNEFVLFMIRNILCNFLKGQNNFLIHDGLGGNFNFNAYEMLFGNHHIYLDFGSKVGFDTIYPRQAMLNLSKRKTVRFNLSENFLTMRQESSSLYLKNKTDEFLNNLNIKT